MDFMKGSGRSTGFSPWLKRWVLVQEGRKCFIFQEGLTDTLSAICTNLCANLRFFDYCVRDSTLLGLGACAERDTAGTDALPIVAQAQNAIVRSVRPDSYFRASSRKSRFTALLVIWSGERPLVGRKAAIRKRGRS